MAAVAVVAPAASAQVAPTALPPFVVVGDYVTIYDLDTPVTVRVDDLRNAIARIQAAGDKASAQAVLDTMPYDLGLAIAWDLTHGVEVMSSDDRTPPEEDVDRATAQDPEPPAQAEDPVTTLNNAQSANYVTPTTVCTYHSARDKRQMNTLISRATLYKFHMYAAWRGCDNGTNAPADEGLDAYYSDLDPFFTCTENSDLPSKSAGPYLAPIVRFRVSGECYQGFEFAGKGFGIGKNHPYIDNEYDWAGHRTLRTGSAH